MPDHVGLEPAVLPVIEPGRPGLDRQGLVVRPVRPVRPVQEQQLPQPFQLLRSVLVPQRKLLHDLVVPLKIAVYERTGEFCENMNHEPGLFYGFLKDGFNFPLPESLSKRNISYLSESKLYLSVLFALDA
jgi:hypothetical protein